MNTRGGRTWLRLGLAGAFAVALLSVDAPGATAHGESAGPLGPQQVGGPAGILADAASQDRCDPVDPAACLLPFPNDHFTRPDGTAKTGRRLDLDPLSMPRNVEGKPIDPNEWNRNDGFSPGQPAVTMVPGLDPAHTALPPITDPSASKRSGSAVVAVDANTGERHLVWAEL